MSLPRSAWLPALLALACHRGAPAPPALDPTGAPATARAEPARGGPTELARVEIVAVGDIMMHGMVKRSARVADQRDEQGTTTNHAGYDLLFQEVSPLLTGADLAFGNLETPVAPDHDHGTREEVFNVQPVLLQALEHAGFDLLSFANNHVYDQLRDGFVETLDRLDASALLYAGSGRRCAEARRARIVEVDGIKLGFLAATGLFNDAMNASDEEPCSFFLDERAVLASAAQARAAGAELVILSVHWGEEYETRARPVHVELAHRLMEGGVDVILGHHPHVLQGVEVYQAADGRITLAAYSLGNFISNQSRWYVQGLNKPRSACPRDGLALRFAAVRKDYGRGVQRVELADLRAEPLWTDNNTWNRPKGDDPLIQVKPVYRELAQARAQLETATEDEQVVALQRRIALLELRLQVTREIAGPWLFPEESPE